MSLDSPLSLSTPAHSDSAANSPTQPPLAFGIAEEEEDLGEEDTDEGDSEEEEDQLGDGA